MHMLPQKIAELGALTRTLDQHLTQLGVMLVFSCNDSLRLLGTGWIDSEELESFVL